MMLFVTSSQQSRQFLPNRRLFAALIEMVRNQLILQRKYP